MIVLSTALAAVGVATAAAFYALVPGYGPLYFSTLALASVVGILSYAASKHANLRGPSSMILGGCVIYWSLAGLKLPEWINGIALILVPVIIVGAVSQLWREHHRQPAKVR